MPGEYKIPKNIEIEDKILGPFTLRQFLYMIGGGVVVYFLFLTLGQINLSLFIIIVLPIILLDLALVFVRINERSFLAFLGYFSIYLLEPKVRTWQKSTRIKRIMIQSETESEQSKREVVRRTKKGRLRSRLAELAMIVDTKGWSRETEDVEMKGRVTSAMETTPTVKVTLEKKKEALEDVFADLEAAMERVTAEAEKKAEEKELKELAERLSGLIAKR